MTHQSPSSGGCNCGAVRFQVSPSRSVSASYCHCTRCQCSPPVRLRKARTAPGAFSRADRPPSRSPAGAAAGGVGEVLLPELRIGALTARTRPRPQWSPSASVHRCYRPSARSGASSSRLAAAPWEAIPKMGCRATTRAGRAAPGAVERACEQVVQASPSPRRWSAPEHVALDARAARSACSRAARPRPWSVTRCRRRSLGSRWRVAKPSASSSFSSSTQLFASRCMPSLERLLRGLLVLTQVGERHQVLETDAEQILAAAAIDDAREGRVSSTIGRGLSSSPSPGILTIRR